MNTSRGFGNHRREYDQVVCELKDDNFRQCRNKACRYGAAEIIVGRFWEKKVAGKRRADGKKEKQRKLPSAAFRLVPSPRYFANLLKRSQNNTLATGTHHANRG
jgi:hypothetical protein